MLENTLKLFPREADLHMALAALAEASKNLAEAEKRADGRP